MVPQYRAANRSSPLRSLWRVAWRGLALAVLLSAGLVVLLRIVDPPTTAFMLGARLDAWRDGGELVVEQRWVPWSCLPEALRLAVIAAEDQTFPRHYGFDVAQIADALAQARQGGRIRGASTLTQQTAKNLFLWPGQSWSRKVLEAALTLLIETAWPKRRILEVYLNVAEFGQGVYGAEAAARRYFGRPAQRLNTAESALLAAVLPAPRRFDAGAPSAYVRERQRWILRQMSQVRGLPGMAALLEPGGRCPVQD